MPRREIYQKYKESLREYNREYLKKWRLKQGTKPRTKLSIEEKKVRQKESYRKWRIRNLDYQRNRFIQMPEEHQKYLSRQALNRAVIRGDITRKICGANMCVEIGEAHHDDYSKPYDVKWLCKTHHEDYHKKIDNQKIKII
jgi:hypothetical protein